MTGISAQVHEINKVYAWIKQMSFPEPWYLNRGRSTLERLDVDRSAAPTGAMLKVMRDNIERGSSLAYSVDTYATLMWNREYSNNITFIPIDNDLQTQPVTLSVQDQSIWVSRIKNLDPDWILVYTASGLTRVLTERLTDRFYAVVFADALIGQENIDRWNMVLLRRVR